MKMNEEAQPPVVTKGKVLFRVAATLVIIGAVSGLLLMLLIQSLSQKSERRGAAIDQVQAYAYSAVEASNGMKLHALKTKPANVSLEVIANNVTSSDRTGINGGFFYGKSLVSLAVVNGKPINGAKTEYGSGWENMKFARGTLVWDGQTDSLGVQVARQATELKVKDASRFWAQGGISMTLSDDSGWEAQAEAEQAPFPAEPRLRSGAVYDSQGYLYLIVSETEGTLAAFRDAIKEQLGEYGLVDGIFLDGDGSSQLLAKEIALPGDNRPVVQMLRIMK